MILQKYYSSFAEFILPLVDSFLCTRAKSLQSCPTLCDPMDSSPPGSSVHRILEARILEWVAISFSTSWLHSYVKYLTSKEINLWCFRWLSTLKSCRCQKSHAEAPARVRSSGVVHTATQAKLFKRATFATAAERAVLESAFAVYFLGPWICPDTLDGGRTKMIWKGHGGLDFHFQTVECFRQGKWSINSHYSVQLQKTQFGASVQQMATPLANAPSRKHKTGSWSSAIADWGQEWTPAPRGSQLLLTLQQIKLSPGPQRALVRCARGALGSMLPFRAGYLYQRPR